MIRLLSLFSGIGAFEKALDRIGAKYELVNYCEIDKYASAAYAAVHDVSEELNLRDVQTIDCDKLKNRGVNLVTYGFPCVPEGFLIKTDAGYKPIEDVVSGDHVLTHANIYRKVVRTMSRKTDHIIHIKGVGCADLQVTENHPVYVLRNGVFEFVKAKDLSLNDKIVFNINTASKKTDISDNVLWLMGRYFADGYKENHSLNRVIFCIGKHKTEEFEKHISGINFVKYHNERNCVEYKLIDNNIEPLFAEFVSGSANKEIPMWIIDLPKEQLKQFFDGYYSGDGHNRADRELSMFSTVSKKMAFGLQDIVIKLFNVVPTLNIRHDKRSKTFNNSYCFQFSLRPKNQTIINDKICTEIKSITKECTETEVYNFEVETDNSYTVNNVVVHNCQDISVAGNMKGFEHNGQKTRSGLFYDALKVIRELQPEIAIAENVKALTGKKFEAEFAAVRGGLADAGYNNYYAVLNASDYGIPQHRERVFIVSIRKDIDRDKFAFPQKEPLRLRVKDLLEYEVEEKYYIDTDRARELIRKLAEEGKLPGNEPAIAAMRGRDPENPSNRHSGVHTEQKIEVNTFGTSNTITTVQKDNHIIEPNIKTVGNLDGHETGRVLDADGITQSLKGTDHKNPVKIALKQVGETGPHQTDRVYDPDGLSRSLKSTDYTHPVNIAEAKQAENAMPKTLDIVNDHEGCCKTIMSRYYKTSPRHLASDARIVSSGVIERFDTGCKAVGDLKVGGERGLVYDAEKSMCTLSATQYKDPHKVLNEYRIRKLTPKECWRLMGFDDDDFEKAKAAGISNTQLYKQAGNSIVVQVLERIFEKLIETQGIGDGNE